MVIACLGVIGVQRMHVRTRLQIREAARARPAAGRHCRVRARLPRSTSALALDTARLCLMDSLACMFQALDHPACTKLLGPVVPGAVLPGGARVPGTAWELDPVQAAFNIGTLVRWLDFNDTWLAAEWGHPSDNLGAILAVADYVSRRNVAARPAAAHDARRARRDDQGPRDPGRARAGEQLQPRRPRPRAAGAHRLDGRRGGAAGRRSRADDQRHLERLARRRRPAHLPPRPQHRLAQELGRRRRDQPRRAARAHGAHRRDGLPLGAHGAQVGLLRRAVRRQARHARRGRWAAT